MDGAVKNLNLKVGFEFYHEVKLFRLKLESFDRTYIHAHFLTVCRQWHFEYWPSYVQLFLVGPYNTFI